VEDDDEAPGAHPGSQLDLRTVHQTSQALNTVIFYISRVLTISGPKQALDTAIFYSSCKPALYIYVSQALITVVDLHQLLARPSIL
jgi:hypothetical protein